MGDRNGCSNHMIGDRIKFINFEKINGGSVNSDDVESTQVYDKGSISIDGKIKTKDVLYVKGLRHNFLNAS